MGPPTQDNIGSPGARNGHGGIIAPGTVIAGKYRVERRLARGGQASVYLASQEPLDRPVALKILAPPPGEYTSEEQDTFEQRFLLEARTLAALDHPNIVTIHDYGDTGDGRFYLAMEYIGGDRMLDLLRDGRMDPTRAVDLVLQVCRALRYAHQRGVVHRDVKNSNVLVRKKDDGTEQVKVVDFGLVKLSRLDTTITQTGMILGSPHFMAPEQATGEHLDHRADIYATGVLLFCALMGKYPFDGPHATAIITAHMTRSPPRFDAVNSAADIPDGLETIVRRCLEKKAKDRFPHMETLISELKPFHPDGRVEGISGEYHTLSAQAPPSAWDWRVMGTGIVAGGVIAAVIAIVLAIGIIVVSLMHRESELKPPVVVMKPIQTKSVVQEPPDTEDAAATEPATPPRSKAKAARRPRPDATPVPEPQPPAKAPTRPRRRTSDLRDPWSE
jgi:serine/threonine protein kinase